MQDHVKLSSIPSSIPFSFFSRKFSLAFSFSIEHVVIPLHAGSELLRRARLALKFVEKHARRATLLLETGNSLLALESAARRMALLLSDWNRSRRPAVSLVTVRTNGFPQVLGTLEDVDLLLVPECCRTFEAPAGGIPCPVLVLDPA